MTADDAGRSITLLDEELALLAPGTGPLPHLDRLEDAEHDAALRTTARSLLVRGLAVAGAPGAELVPAPDVAPLVAPLSTGGRQVHLVAALRDTQHAVLTVLHPLDARLVLVHDTTEDGVHLLTLLPRDQARAQLAAALDPLGRASATAPPAAPLPRLDEPDAVARLSLVEGGVASELSVVTVDGTCWCLRPGDPVHADPLDSAGLARLLDELLG